MLIINRLIVLIMGLLCACSVNAEQGELWQTRSEMSNATYGQLDLGTNNECKEKGWFERLQKNQQAETEGCQETLQKISADKYSWSKICDTSSQHGEISILNAKQFTTKAEFKSEEGVFLLNATSTLVGSCELGEDDE